MPLIDPGCEPAWSPWRVFSLKRRVQDVPRPVQTTTPTTPWKINMEPENHSVVVEEQTKYIIVFQSSMLQVSCGLIYSGVIGPSHRREEIKRLADMLLLKLSICHTPIVWMKGSDFGVIISSPEESVLSTQGVLAGNRSTWLVLIPYIISAVTQILTQHLRST